MADTIRCPMCGKPNPTDLDVCQFCGARLKPLLSPSPDSSRSIKAGEQPVQKGTAEFEKVKPINLGSIHPGEAPTVKKTSELESALPSWLRSLRGSEDAVGPEPDDSAPFEGDLSNLPGGEPASQPAGGSADWLSGLDKAASQEEEAVPDWLAGLRGDEKPAGSSGEPAGEAAPDLGSADWMSRLGEPSTSAPSDSLPFSEPASTEAPAADRQTPAWLKDLQAPEPAAPARDEGKLPDWFSSLPEIPQESAPQTPSTPSDSIPGWLDQLEEKASAPAAEPPAMAPAGPVPGEGLPDWLNQLQEKTAGPEPASQPEAAAIPNAGSDLPDWLSQFQQAGAASEETPPPSNEPVPDWLSNLEPPTELPPATSTEAAPDWLSGLEAKAASELEAVPPLTEAEPAAEIPHAEALPSWLSQLQAETNIEEPSQPPQALFEPTMEHSTPDVAAAHLPDWLSGIQPVTPPAEETPAFVGEEPASVPEPAGAGEKPFTMETPDWLSAVTPEPGAEKNAPEEEQAPAGGIQAAELPSWVQAMRPLESVVDQNKPPAIEENQVTEQSGPLAGLTGVLPAGAGLGMSRKPPAYSIKLQVSTTQQRYISDLEKLVAGETRASAAKGERAQANQMWRWLIAALLILAVGIPFIFPQARMTPPVGSKFPTTDGGAAAALLNGLPASAPVLVAFDYDPALSGELEMVAAPLIDQLQSKGARLTVVSTSPTGPVLAERFFQHASLVNSHQYKSGEQYVDLGYIAGGPAGISLFASQPSVSMPVAVDGHPAWSQPPLQGVSKLSDFASVIILTGDADTGRNWVEQAGAYLGQTPMIMVISAQAEPMIQPYFASGQLKGLVSGTVDAKISEQNYNRPGLANHYWNSFSLGALIAELIIVFGAIYGAFTAWRLHPSKPKTKA